MGLENKVAMVTGSAGSGMGRSSALTLAREGAKVTVNYRTSEDAAQAVVDGDSSQLSGAATSNTPPSRGGMYSPILMFKSATEYVAVPPLASTVFFAFFDVLEAGPSQPAAAMDTAKDTSHVGH